MDECPDCCRVLDKYVFCVRCKGLINIVTELISACLLCKWDTPKISYLVGGGFELKGKDRFIGILKHDKLSLNRQNRRCRYLRTLTEEIKFDSNVPDFKSIIEGVKKFYEYSYWE